MAASMENTAGPHREIELIGLKGENPI